MDVKYRENFIAAWHTGGWVLTCGVPHAYVLLSTKLTSRVPFLCTRTATNIYGTGTSVCGPPANWSIFTIKGFRAGHFFFNWPPLLKFNYLFIFTSYEQTLENCTFANRYKRFELLCMAHISGDTVTLSCIHCILSENRGIFLRKLLNSESPPFNWPFVKQYLRLFISIWSGFVNSKRFLPKCRKRLLGTRGGQTRSCSVGWIQSYEKNCSVEW